MCRTTYIYLCDIYVSMAEIERMYLLEEAAEFLGTKPRELRKYISEGRLPAIKIGQTWRVKESTIKKIQAGELII